ncbi:hypothetical protein GCM10022233_11370 [Streptomyces shaanxiensis]|uniref:Uncharacterized protein n=1 Tax=Streptomyces shaanxiensis TaxID=653357 RepID=A0ABP7UI77_9ACTN
MVGLRGRYGEGGEGQGAGDGGHGGSNAHALPHMERAPQSTVSRSGSRGAQVIKESVDSVDQISDGNEWLYDW